MLGISIGRIPTSFFVPGCQETSICTSWKYLWLDRICLVRPYKLDVDKFYMKNFLLFLGAVTALLCSCTILFSQSARSGVVRFTMDEVTDLFMPPDLHVDIDFEDANGNNVLEATESGIIKLRIKNTGGKADQIKISVLPEAPYKNLSLAQTEITTSLAKEESRTFSFPIDASIDVPTGRFRYKIKVQEPLGFDIDAVLVLPTFEYQRARLKVQGVAIVDAGLGLKAINNNPDGKVQRGEVVKAFIAIQNIGRGPATGITYKIVSTDPNVMLLSDTGVAKSVSGRLNPMNVGQDESVSVRLSVNNNYSSTSKYLPVFIQVTEDKGYGNINTYNVPIPLGESPDAISIVDIDGDYNRLLAQQKVKVESSDNRISSSNIIRDISIAPSGYPLYANAIAIVLGAEENQYGVAPAPYARRDAELMASYFKSSLGIKPENVLVKTNSNITKNALEDIFNANYGHLKSMVTKGVTDVFVYYSGHGIPDFDSKGESDVYMFPYDARREYIRERGYSLNRLYSELNDLGAKSVTVILDACFSGSSRQSQTILAQNISNTKGVAWNDFSARPWETNPNFRLFTSSTGSETSLGNDQSQSGLFTYYLACGLQGDADLDSNGKITMTELVEFVTEKVQTAARKVRSSSQTPQFYGNSEFVIESIK